jgi:hypothetical protein
LSSKPGYGSQRKHESILARAHARLTTKIGPKLNSCPRRYFTEHLAGVFRKQPFESDWN